MRCDVPRRQRVETMNVKSQFDPIGSPLMQGLLTGKKHVTPLLEAEELTL